MIDLKGRDREQRLIADALDGALQGPATGLLLHGPAGIGKTALVRQARRAATDRGFATLEAIGVEGVAAAPYRGLIELFTGFSVAGRVGPQSATIGDDVRRLLAEAGSSNTVRMAQLFVHAVTGLAEQRPLLVVLDDPQWLDEPTQQLVRLLAQRAESDRIVILVASRVPPPWWHATGLPSHEVTGLDERSGVELLVGRFGVDAALAADCWRATGGNPLALLELGPAWSPEVGGAGGVSNRLRRALDQRLPPSGGKAGNTLLAVALSRPFSSLDSELDGGTIDVALASGLLERHGGTLRFAHPLLRSRVVSRAGPAAIRRAHRTLAEAARRNGDADSWLWHAAAATDSPDETVAAALFELGQACRRRRATTEWRLAAEESARLTADPDLAAWRLADAVDAAWFSSDHQRVEELAGRVLSLSSAPGVVGKLATAYGQEVMWRDGPRAGYQYLVERAESIAAAEPASAARCLAHASAAAVLTLRIDLALEAAHQGMRLAERDGDPVVVVVARHALAVVGQLVGRPGAEAELADVEEVGLHAVAAGLTDAEHLVNGAALAHAYAERTDRAIELLGGVLRRSSAAGALEWAAQARAALAELAVRTGRWTEAYGLIRATLDDPDWGVPGERAFVHAIHARVCAGLGRIDECRAAAARAKELALPIDLTIAEAWADSALGLLELGVGDPHAALVHLERVARVFDQSGIVETGTLWWRGDHLDALVAVGDRQGAQQRIDRLVGPGAPRRRHAAMVAARARAGLADDDTVAEREFADAVELAHALGSPFELARTLLARARHRATRGGEGHDDARRARAVFEVLGAAPWVEQIDGAPGTRPLALDRLSKTELRVAMAVGRGLTNREAALELCLSRKTVDFYLQSIYRKLDVGNRTEMSRALFGGPAA